MTYRTKPMKDYTILNDVHMKILKSLSEEEVYQVIVDTAYELTGCEWCSLFTRLGNRFRSTRSKGSSSLLPKSLSLDQALSFIGGPVNIRVLREKAESGLDLGGSFASAPIPIRDELHGLLTVSHSEEKAFDENDLRGLTYLANQSTAALERIKMVQELQLALKNEKKARARIGQMNRILETANEVAILIGSILKLDDLLKQVVITIRKRLDYQNVAILLLDKRGRLRVRAYVGYWGQNLAKYEMSINRRSISRWVVDHGKPLIVSDVRKESRYVGDRSRGKSEIALPLKRRGRIMGVLDVEKVKVKSLGKKDLRLLSLLASRISLAIENSLLYEETERLANTDEITGIYNYRYLKSALGGSRNKKKMNRVSLLMFDLDNFKAYNDHYGHPAGDRVLRDFAKLLKREVDEGGLVSRYGGDEFLVLLTETSKADAKIFAERLLGTVEEKLEKKKITVSIGFANYPEDVKKKIDLIDAVDMALYRAKARGKSRVSA